MALAPRQASSRSVQRVEPSGSTESSVTTRTPVPTLSSPPPELSVSPGQVAELSSKTLWEQICEEYQAELPPFPKGYEVKQEPEITVSPPEETVSHGFKIEHYFPPPPLTRVSHVPCPLKVSETVDPKTCSPRKYLETYIFPVLLPGMTSLLHQAKKEKCFERKRTKFIACDFLTEWLYNQNPKRMGEPFTEFFSIPFVSEWLIDHPRPPVPLSLLLTDMDAAIAIQSFWRAYLVRCDPEIQELRHWQKKLREDKHIRQRVKMFWIKQERKVKCTMEDHEELAGTTPSP
ncbi:IQ domain-containing protein K isoform X2 [Sciurus carolinensis]|uniref:IQ domain-containing protein K isoform X2 n=1 Tax=Sciurus carolinensis TaxID=30640 RepID=UPI001FB26542|nr:IQ domain-containing protein K isoform X2 [Sciurus carolinensis]